ncbi:MAG: chorismate mutase [Selenomonadaceae bacterium]|nr:chorismate mutase [Selenomonadaceae bacterium]
MALRGIRGAATVETNTKEDIWQVARLLMTQLMSMNQLNFDQVGAAIFSTTEDLTAAFPTTGVRQLPSFSHIPLFDTREPSIDNSLPMCIRVLLLVDIETNPRDICHVYLGKAKALRPDLSN